MSDRTVTAKLPAAFLVYGNLIPQDGSNVRRPAGQAQTVVSGSGRV
jgi:hypothetical protein